MKNEKLDGLGEVLMREVRDGSVVDLEMVLDGRMKGELATRTRASLAALGTEELKSIAVVLPQIVDRVLHNLLASIEQHDELELRYGVGPAALDASRASDGLAGELYGDDGWIARFS